MRRVLTPAALRHAAAASLAAAIFALDGFTSIGGAVAVLYVLVLLVADDSCDHGRLPLWSWTCVGLTLLAFAIAHGAASDLDELLRMAVSLAAIGVTSRLLLRRRALGAHILRSERRYRAVFDTLAVAIWEHDFRDVDAALAELRAQGVTDLRGWLERNPDFVNRTRAMVRITDVNQTALDLMGVDTKDAFFRCLSEFLPETDESFIECLIAIDERRAVFQAETQVRRRDGTEVDIIVAFGLGCPGALEGVPASVLDITHRRQLESTIAQTRGQLERAQRSGALGAMSSTIAHEVNQPLSAIRSFADAASHWLRHDPPEVEEARAALATLGEAVDHAHGVVRRVRGLVRDAAAEMAPVDLAALAADAIALIRRDPAAQAARLHVDAPAGGVALIGDRVLLQQLFHNLIGNALQAMEGLPPPQRRVTVSLADEGDAAVCTVRDTGPGWRIDHPDTALEPFFTTRDEGMGLGLSICRSVVALHHGTIELADHPEGGAEVRVRLPLAAAH